MSQELPAEFNVLTERVIGAAIAVHRVLGTGYLESVYENALALELDRRGIQYSRQHAFSVSCLDVVMGSGKIDFLIEQPLIVKLKAIESILPVHQQQVRNYLKATNIQLAMLINFNVPRLKNGIQRIIRSLRLRALCVKPDHHDASHPQHPPQPRPTLHRSSPLARCAL